MERKKRSKGSVWEFCYANKIFGTFEEEMKAYGQKWVTFCTHTHTHTHAAKLVVRIQAWSPYLRKDIDMLEKIQRRATKLIPRLRDLTYEERRNVD